MKHPLIALALLLASGLATHAAPVADPIVLTRDLPDHYAPGDPFTVTLVCDIRTIEGINAFTFIELLPEGWKASEPLQDGKPGSAFAVTDNPREVHGLVMQPLKKPYIFTYIATPLESGNVSWPTGKLMYIHYGKRTTKPILGKERVAQKARPKVADPKAKTKAPPPMPQSTATPKPKK